MNKFLKVSAMILAASLLSSTGYAALSATGTSNAAVAVSLSITSSANLEFGTFAASGSSGTVTLTGGVRAKTGGVTLLSGGATSTSATFNVTGQSGGTYNLTIPASVSLTGPGPAMSASLNTVGGTSARTLTGGTNTITVDSSSTGLAVAANQTPGSYTGTYSVSVAY